jgi:hypothetical protein
MEPPTRVVHLKIKGGAVVQDCDVYIGRHMYQGGWRLPGSKWANPFRLADFGHDRRRVLDAYEAHVRADPALMAALPELRGKRLGCWCKPLACHGDILVRLLAELDAPPPPVYAPPPPVADDDLIWQALGLE